MAKKSPNPIDKHVGARVRMRRMLVGMSQEKLGEALGITFQQIQKYEKGVNRVSASRMQQIAGVLSVPIEFFFDGAPQLDDGTATGFSEPAGTAYVAEFMASSEGLQLMKAFLRIRDGRVRRRIVDLVSAMADSSSEEPAPSE